MIGNSSYPSIKRLDYTSRLDAMSMLKGITQLGKSRTADFRIDGSNSSAYVAISKWLVGDPTMECIDPRSGGIIRGDLAKGLYIYGPTGVGKSWAMELASEAAQRLGLGFEVGGFRRNLTWWNMRADKIVASYASDGSLSRLCDPSEVRCLCIQDFGSEPTSATFMGSRCEVVRQIVEARADHQGIFTHFTSNIPLRDREGLTRIYGERVASRLIGCCNYLEIGGEDRR